MCIRLFSRGEATELGLRQTLLPRVRPGWWGGGKLDFMLFLQESGDIQAV